jgi:hypothetical protein
MKTFLTACVLLLISGCSYVVELPLVVQTQTEWCWAAIGSMAAAHGSIPIRQCEVANIAYPGKKCCLRPYECNIRLSVVSFDRLLQNDLGLTITTQKELPSYEEMRRHIAANRIIIYAYGSFLEGHVVIIHGYNGNFFLIANPALGDMWIEEPLYQKTRWQTLYVGIVEATR